MTSKAKILLFIKSLGLGGAERLLVDSLPYLDRTRFDYHVAYMTPWKDTLVPQISAAGVSVSCLGNSASARESLGATNGNQVTAPRSVQSAIGLPQAYLRLHQLQRHEGFDLIHADMPLAGILARILGRRQGLPVVYTEHNLLERYHPLTRWAHRATFGWQSCVLCVSAEVQASIERAGGSRQTTVRTLLNGVPVEQVRREASGLAALRAELKLAPDHFIVGSVAVFRTQKRLSDWLAVASEIAQRRTDVSFLLVGDGPEMPVVRAKVRELGLENRIRLPGFREDGRRCIGLMDIFLMTSQYEGLPIALLEAMTLGKPVVATNVGGIPEVITDGEEGQLASAGDVEALAQHVNNLLDHSDRRQRMGRQGAAKIEAQYHIRHRVRAIEHLYTELLGPERNHD